MNVDLMSVVNSMRKEHDRARANCQTKITEDQERNFKKLLLRTPPEYQESDQVKRFLKEKPLKERTHAEIVVKIKEVRNIIEIEKLKQGLAMVTPEQICYVASLEDKFSPQFKALSSVYNRYHNKLDRGMLTEHNANQYIHYFEKHLSVLPSKSFLKDIDTENLYDIEYN